MHPGTNCADAPVGIAGQEGWFLNQIGRGFTLLSFGPAPVAQVAFGPVQVKLLEVGKDIEDKQGILAERYDATPGTVYLLRPDQHVAARWRQFDKAKIARALARALAA